MKFQIKHEIKGRLRIHMKQSRMTFEQADILHYAIQKMDASAQSRYTSAPEML